MSNEREKTIPFFGFFSVDPGGELADCFSECPFYQVGCHTKGMIKETVLQDPNLMKPLPAYISNCDAENKGFKPTINRNAYSAGTCTIAEN